MKKIQASREISAAPSPMKMPRNSRASMMPTNSANCCALRGTDSLVMMIRKMNRLSIDRLYSVSQPAKNSPEYAGPAQKCMAMPNRIARAT